MGYRLNRLDEPVLIAVTKPLLTEFGIHLRLESCVEAWTVRPLSSLDNLSLLDISGGFKRDKRLLT